MNGITYYVSQDEILAQLAEECAELGQAALKLRRTMIKTNPTPKPRENALASLNEEVADVILCLENVVGLDEKRIEETKEFKRERWIARLKGKS